MTPIARLGGLVDFLSGCPFKSVLFNTDGVGMRLARIRDVMPGQSSTYYSGEYEKAYVLADGDYLIGMDGEFNLAPWRGGPALLNQRVCKIGHVNSELDLGYLARFLPSALKAIEAATPFVTVKHLSVKSLREIQIPLPPVDEQRRIAAILDQADRLRAKRREALAHLDDLTQSIFLDMFGHSREMPRQPLAESVLEFRYGTSNKSEADGHPALRIPNVVGGTVDTSELKLVPVTDAEFNRLRLVEGDVLFVRTNGNPDNVGRCAVFTCSAARRNGHSPDHFIYASYLIRARLDVNRANPVFVREFMLGVAGRRQLRERSKTSARQYNINIEGIGSVELPVVLLAHQERFATRVAEIEKSRRMQQVHLARLETLFASLQSRAFAGEL